MLRVSGERDALQSSGRTPAPAIPASRERNPREGKRHVGQPFTPTYNQAVHYRRTRRPAYERQQIKPTLISINT